MSRVSAITVTTSRGGRAEIDIDNLKTALVDALGVVEDDENAQVDERVSCLETRIAELEGEGSLIRRAADEIRYGNLDEALVYLARAIPALDGLPAPVARELARRETRRAAA